MKLLPMLPLPKNWSLPFLSALTRPNPAYFITLGLLALIGFLIQFGFDTADPLIPFKKK